MLHKYHSDNDFYKNNDVLCVIRLNVNTEYFKSKFNLYRFLYFNHLQNHSYKTIPPMSFNPETKIVKTIHTVLFNEIDEIFFYMKESNGNYKIYDCDFSIKSNIKN